MATVYYKGSASDWGNIYISDFLGNYNANASLLNATVYYFSETAPTEEGDFWHYVDGEITVWN